MTDSDAPSRRERSEPRRPGELGRLGEPRQPGPGGPGEHDGRREPGAPPHLGDPRQPGDPPRREQDDSDRQGRSGDPRQPGDPPRREQDDSDRQGRSGDPRQPGDPPRREQDDSDPQGGFGDPRQPGDPPRREQDDSDRQGRSGEPRQPGEPDGPGDPVRRERSEPGQPEQCEPSPQGRPDASSRHEQGEDGSPVEQRQTDPATPIDDTDETEVFPPTLREVLLRPRWLALLLLCLVVAGIFAWLGQWQLSRAIDTNPVPPGATEEVQPIAEVATPGEYLPEPLVGQRVEVSGRWIPGDFLIVTSRFNDGEEGYWVTGQLRIDGTAGPASVAVAVGWASTSDDAHAAARQFEADAAADDRLITVVGRLISDEGPLPPPRGADPQTMTRMSPAAHLSRWHDIEGLDVYRPYLAAETAPAPLADIDSPAPDEGPGVNWLNIFYAIEWAIFAGFAFYLWYRLGRDAWEKEVEDVEDAAVAAP